MAPLASDHLPGRNMSDTGLTPLELSILNKLYELHSSVGFPSPSLVSVVRRENTGSGRYVDLASMHAIQVDDGYLDLGGSYIRMEGMPNSMMAVALIRGHLLRQLEISVYGEAVWDGVERSWSIS